jgi:uncharacterized protein YecE (DUF72 family)
MTDPVPNHSIRIGPAGWSYKDWAGIVYPKRRPSGFHEAAYLAQYFDTIEINTSFYGPIAPDSARKWIELVSGNPRFLFTAKLWQKFTHEQGASAEDVRAVRVGVDVLQETGKLGAVLLQFPFSFHRTPEALDYLKKLFAQFAEYPLVVEVRHSSWNEKSFYELLRERGVGFCNIDQPLIGRSLKPSERATAKVGYVRLHGRRYDTWFSDDPATPPEERYNYLYSSKELEPWAERIRRVAEGSQSTFVITNNHYEGKGVVNALQLIHLLTKRPVTAPPILIEHYPALETICSTTGITPNLFSR